MSQSYHCKLQESVTVDVSLGDTVTHRLNLTEILPLEEMKELLRQQLRAQGFSEDGDRYTHTAEVTTGGLAVAAGAVGLEKHLTWNRNAVGPDHAASLDPAGLAEYVDFVRRARGAVGDGMKRSNPIEADVRRVARQSLRAARSLPSGTRLSATDIAVKRPGDGIEPWRLEEILGRELRVALEPDAPIREGDLG